MREIPFGKPILGEEERQAVLDVLGGTMLVHGPRAKQFEEDFAAFTGAPHAVSVASCTAGMHLAYLAWGIGAGDEVIVPAQTHTATAHAVAFTGAMPVFVDAEPATGNLDVTALEAAVTPRTKAISVVHFLGVSVDMPAVLAVARRHNLRVLEDCALAVGTRLDGVHAGLHGDAGCFSFYPVKHMTTAEGGMFITRHGDLAAKVTHLKAFGVDRVVGERKEPGIYDVTALGYNYRMNELEAALGVEQLKRVPDFLAKRADNFAALRDALHEVPQLDTLLGEGEGTCSHYCLSAVLRDDIAPRRAEVVAALKARGVGTSVYYPQPVPHMTYYRERFGFGADTFPCAAAISHRSIALPVGPHLTPDDMAYVAGSLRAVLAEVAP